MTYATVMVGMALDQSNEARLEVAGQLAERFVSTVIGIAAAEFSPPLYFTDGEQAEKVIDQGRAAVKNRLADLEAEFRAAMQNRATEAEWRSAEDFPARYIIPEARAADIIVVGEARGGIGDPFLQRLRWSAGGQSALQGEVLFSLSRRAREIQTRRQAEV